ncbi:MAG: RHS repeat-associated core domain-containing protein [Pseudomonadales bacterium]
MTVVSGSTNGRIYDPHLARFVQADPFVQAPSDLQMLNRYSYVRNNPVNATDPSGFFKLRDVAGIIAGGIGFFVCGPGCAAAAVSAVTYVQTGSFKAALIAGVSTYAFASVGASFLESGASIFSKAGAIFVAKMGVIGGITSMLQGGKFGHGFVSAGFGSVLAGAISNTLAPIFRDTTPIISRAIAGGTISEITGGKFANGAAYAAFAYVVNSVASDGAGGVGGFSFKSAFRSLGQSLGLVSARTGVVTVEEIYGDSYGETSTQETAATPEPYGRLAHGVRELFPARGWTPSAAQGRLAAMNSVYDQHTTILGAAALSPVIVHSIAVNGGTVLAGRASALAGRGSAWAGRNAKNLCVAASLCTLAETPAGNIVIQSSDDVIRALQTRESIRRGIDATSGIRSIGGP